MIGLRTPGWDEDETMQDATARPPANSSDAAVSFQATAGSANSASPAASSHAAARPADSSGSAVSHRASANPHEDRGGAVRRPAHSAVDERPGKRRGGATAATDVTMRGPNENVIITADDLNDPTAWTQGRARDADGDVGMSNLGVQDGCQDEEPLHHVAEVYSPPRVAPIARQKGWAGGWSLDITTRDAQGRPWDFDCADTRARAEALVARTRPALLILSPMCTYFSPIMQLAKLGMDPAEFDRRYARALDHLRFAFRLIQLQISEGRYFLFEHPANASSWNLDFVKEVTDRPGCILVLTHQCRFGQQGRDDIGTGLVKKPTRFLTNCPGIAHHLNKQCTGGHRHIQTVGNSKVLSQCAVYPPALCHAIVKGFAHSMRHADRGARRQATANDLPALGLDDPDDDSSDYNAVAYDDAKGGELSVPLVRKAREEEMEFVRSRQIYSYSTVSECRARTGQPPIGTKWVDTNKGDDQRPKYRSRLVATEVRKPWSDKWFAATPPIEALRLMVLLAARGNPKTGRPRRTLLLDVSRAHWYPEAKRDVWIRLPAEDPRADEPGVCGKLNRTMYGTLDAAQSWGDHYSKILTDAGFIKGLASPCHFFHPSRDIPLLVHGDDFIAAAEDDQLEWVEKLLKGKYECKSTLIGPGPGAQPEGRILGRIITYYDWGIQYEADPVHAETILRELGLESARSVGSPCADLPASFHAAGDSSGSLADRRRAVGSQKDRPLELPATESLPELESPALEGDALRRYQSVAARLNYLALDRPDLQYAAKERMRRMSDATEADEAKLKRAGRYLKGYPRAVLKFPWGSPPPALTCYVDADFAGCTSTRKSTSGGAIFWGTACLKSWSKTQPTIALSSGESELAAVVKGAAEAMGLKAVCQDFGLQVTLAMRSDATAAIGIVGREGLGKVRHLATADLWIQQRVRRGELAVTKWPGADNPADLCTKGLSPDATARHLATMGFSCQEGRAAAAPALKQGAGRTGS